MDGARRLIVSAPFLSLYGKLRAGPGAGRKRAFSGMCQSHFSGKSPGIRHDARLAARSAGLRRSLPTGLLGALARPREGDELLLDCSSRLKPVFLDISIGYLDNAVPRTVYTGQLATHSSPLCRGCWRA